MRFNPAEFIQLCRRAGVELHREGPFLCYDGGRKWRGSAADVLFDAMRQHKDEIMPLLPDSSPQADLFDPYR